MLTIPTGPALRERLTEIQTSNPQGRMRDHAKTLNVSEGALVASCAGGEATRLSPRWLEFLPRLPELGKVMALTRNEAIVHEKIGFYDNVGFFGSMVQVVNRDIDLRIFLRYWRHLFAFEQKRNGQTLHSFQMFDGAGNAVHKIFLRDESNREAFHGLVKEYMDADQSPVFHADAIETPAPVTASVDQAALATRWRNLRDTHDFYPMIRELGLRRRDANALVGEEFARRLPASVFETLLLDAAGHSVPIMIFAGNPGCLQIHTGTVSRIEWMNDWLNVLDPGFNLHVNTGLVAEAWLIRKPTADGVVTSIEFFDKQGEELALVFGERKPGRPELETWRKLTEYAVSTTTLQE